MGLGALPAAESPVIASLLSGRAAGGGGRPEN